MGQKVRPTGFRVGIMTDWMSNWYASKADFCELLVEDRTPAGAQLGLEGVADGIDAPELCHVHVRALQRGQGLCLPTPDPPAVAITLADILSGSPDSRPASARW